MVSDFTRWNERWLLCCNLFWISGHNQSVVSVDFNSKSTLLASGDLDGSVFIWKIDNGVIVDHRQFSEIQVSWVLCVFLLSDPLDFSLAHYLYFYLWKRSRLRLLHELISPLTEVESAFNFHGISWVNAAVSHILITFPSHKYASDVIVHNELTE